MQPHELVQKLFQARKDITSVSALARAIHNQSFQGTLHKFLSGKTASPDQATAARIAKFFGLPIEAIYDAKVATRIAQERGLLDGKEGLQLAVRETKETYAPAPAAWPFKTVSATDLAKLSPPAMRQLERLIVAFIGGPVPTEVDGETWRNAARALATSMDQGIRALPDDEVRAQLANLLGPDFYSAFVLQVDLLTQERPTSAVSALVN